MGEFVARSARDRPVIAAGLADCVLFGLLTGFGCVGRTTSEPCTTLGALPSVAGGARTHAGWAWLTGRRVAQEGGTPLHTAIKCDDEDAVD